MGDKQSDNAAAQLADSVHPVCNLLLDKIDGRIVVVLQSIDFGHRGWVGADSLLQGCQRQFDCKECQRKSTCVKLFTNIQNHSRILFVWMDISIFRTNA